MIVDVLMLLLLAGGFVLGFFRGVVRQVLVVGAWLIVFVAAAYLRLPLGDWLARSSTQFSFDFAQMLAFGVVFLAVFTGALLVIEFAGAGSALTRHPVIDDALGGIVGLAAALLVAASIVVVLDSYFASHPTPGPGEIGWLRDLYAALGDSVLAGPLRDWIIRPLGALLSPILPPDVRTVMA